MTRIFTVFALALISSGAFAQFNQGRMLAGGSVSFTANGYKTKLGTANVKTRTTNFSIAPDFGYFIIDNLAVGAAIGIGTGSSRRKVTNSTIPSDNGETTTTSASFVFSPFARYYLSEVPVFFQLQIGLGGASSTVKQGSNKSSGSSFVFNWTLAGGYAYFLNDYVAIEPMLGYGSTYSDSSDSNVNGIFLSAALQVYLGARN